MRNERQNAKIEMHELQVKLDGYMRDYDRYFVDTNDPALDAQAADFEAKVKALEEKLQQLMIELNEANAKKAEKMMDAGADMVWPK